MGSARRNSANEKPSVSNSDLLSSMTARLTQLEKLNLALKSELKEKNDRVMALEDENRTLRDSASMDVAAKLKQLELEKELALQKAKEMEQFLADYGLKWVGTG